jgi:hypothetical protein
MGRPAGLVVVVIVVRSSMEGAAGRWSKIARTPVSRRRRSRYRSSCLSAEDSELASSGLQVLISIASRWT